MTPLVLTDTEEPPGTPAFQLVERLLVTAAREGPCELHAGPAAPWAPLPDPVPFWLFAYGRAPEVVGEVRRDHFRAILARLGVRLFDGQVYSGAVSRRLVLPDREVRCAAYYGNEDLTGFWLRMHVGGPVDPIARVP